jgi:hypothetical protein
VKAAQTENGGNPYLYYILSQAYHDLSKAEKVTKPFSTTEEMWPIIAAQGKKAVEECGFDGVISTVFETIIGPFNGNIKLDGNSYRTAGDSEGTTAITNARAPIALKAATFYLAFCRNKKGDVLVKLVWNGDEATPRSACKYTSTPRGRIRCTTSGYRRGQALHSGNCGAAYPPSGTAP